MCREQLVKLPPKIGELTAQGAAVFGISIDTPKEAAQLVRDLGLTFPILSDPRMEVIQAYEMKGEGMEMADMGYVVIDRQGQIRAKKIDRRFGDNVSEIVGILEELRREA
jgi:peroxiredoxin Q/BCP